MSMFVVAPKEKFGLAKLEDDISAHLGKRICSVILQGHLQVHYTVLNSLLSKYGVGSYSEKKLYFGGPNFDVKRM
jgi:hypothetical protein